MQILLPFSASKNIQLTGNSASSPRKSLAGSIKGILFLDAEKAPKISL